MITKNTNDILKKQIKEELVKSACEESDKRARVEKVAKILEAVKYKSETDKAEAILSFSRSSLTEAEIETLVKPLRPDYLTDQLTKRGLY